MKPGYPSRKDADCSKQNTFRFLSCTGRRLTEDRANVGDGGHGPYDQLWRPAHSKLREVRTFRH